MRTMAILLLSTESTLLPECHRLRRFLNLALRKRGHPVYYSRGFSKSL
jgi:hypothetical protein